MNVPFVDVSPMTDEEHALLRLVWEHGAITVQTASQVMNLTRVQVGRAAERLLRATFIRRERGGTSLTTVYIITDLGKLVCSHEVTVYLVRHSGSRTAVPLMHLAGMRLGGATVAEIADATGYLNESTVQNHLHRLGMTGKIGRPRKEVG